VGNAYIFSPSEKKNILKSGKGVSAEEVTKPLYDNVSRQDDVTKMQYIDINLWMVGDILHQADRMSLAHSLLIKTPYLNKKIVDLALSLPIEFRVTKSKNKIAFRAAALKHLPKDVAQKKKLGFPVPLRVWLREDKFYTLVKEYFTGETAGKFFQTENLLLLLKHHKNGKVNNSRKIWTVLIFLVWYKQFFEN